MKSSTPAARTPTSDASIADFLKGFAMVQGKVCRILLRGEVIVRTEPHGASTIGSAPAATDGDVIYLNGSVLHTQLRRNNMSARIIKAVNALVKHELAHCIYSPRPPKERINIAAGHPLKEVYDNGMHQAWNMLEDQRIERLFLARFPSMVPHFNILVAEFLLTTASNELETARVFPLIYGRQYLPQQLIAGYREKLKTWMIDYRYMTILEAESFCQEFESIIDEFSLVVYQRNADAKSARAFLLVERYHHMLVKIDGQSLPTGSTAEMRQRQKGERGTESHPSVQEQKESQRDAAEEGEAEDGDEVDGDGEGEGEGGEGEGEDSNLDTDGEGKGKGKSSKEGPGKLRQGTTDEVDPDQTQSTAPVESGGRGSGGGMGESIASQIQDLLDEALNDEVVSNDADRTIASTQAVVQSGAIRSIDLAAPCSYHGTVEVQPEDKRASNDIATILRALKNEMSPTWDRQQKSGRFDVRRYLHDEAGATPPIKVFRKWNEGTEENATMDIIIAIDMSSSMGHYIHATTRSMWVIKSALLKLGIPCAVIGYGDVGPRWPALVLQQQEGFTDNNILQVPALGQSTFVQPAAEAAEYHFSVTHAKNPVFITITDGGFSDRIQTEEVIKRMNHKGIQTVLLGLNLAVSMHGNQSFQIAADIGTPGEIPPVIKKLTASLMRKALHR